MIGVAVWAIPVLAVALLLVCGVKVGPAWLAQVGWAFACLLGGVCHHRGRDLDERRVRLHADGSACPYSGNGQLPAECLPVPPGSVVSVQWDSGAWRDTEWAHAGGAGRRGRSGGIVEVPPEQFPTPAMLAAVGVTVPEVVQLAGAQAMVTYLAGPAAMSLDGILQLVEAIRDRYGTTAAEAAIAWQQRGEQIIPCPLVEFMDDPALTGTERRPAPPAVVVEWEAITYMEGQRKRRRGSGR